MLPHRVPRGPWDQLLPDCSARRHPFSARRRRHGPMAHCQPRVVGQRARPTAVDRHGGVRALRTGLPGLFCSAGCRQGGTVVRRLSRAYRGEGGWWAVTLVWEVWRFNSAAKFPTPNPGAPCFVLLSPCAFTCSMSHSLFLASAKFPTAKFATAKLTRHQIPPPPPYDGSYGQSSMLPLPSVNRCPL